MSRQHTYAGVVAFCLVFVVPVRAQFTPVTAKIHETVETIVDGKVVQTQSNWGNFYRAADGSELRRWLKADGTLDWGNLIENKKRMSYKLDYTLGVARGAAQPPDAKLSSLQPGYMGGGQVLGKWPQDAVEGILCAVDPAKIRY